MEEVHEKESEGEETREEKGEPSKITRRSKKRKNRRMSIMRRNGMRSWRSDTKAKMKKSEEEHEKVRTELARERKERLVRRVEYEWDDKREEQKREQREEEIKEE